MSTIGLQGAADQGDGNAGRDRAGTNPLEPVRRTAMRSIMLWALGVPVILIILLNVFHVI